MTARDRRRPLSRGRIWTARAVAAGADLLQIVVFPFFFEGAASPAADILDFLVAPLMIWLCGWHWAFVPTFVAEMVPLVDLFPSWTAAVVYVTWGGGAGPAEEIEAGTRSGSATGSGSSR